LNKKIKDMKIGRWVAVVSVLAALTFFAAPQTVQAQCPMCKIGAESNMKNGGTQGKGLNAGILYMLATPYLLVGGVAFYWWRNRRRKDEEDVWTTEEQ
jgi:hypothetical protein